MPNKDDFEQDDFGQLCKSFHDLTELLSILRKIVDALQDEAKKAYIKTIDYCAKLDYCVKENYESAIYDVIKAGVLQTPTNVAPEEDEEEDYEEEEDYDKEDWTEEDDEWEEEEELEEEPEGEIGFGEYNPK